MLPKKVYQLIIKGQMRFFGGRREVHVKGVAVCRKLLEAQVLALIEELCDPERTIRALDRETVTHEIVEHTVYYE